jgi:hypothetical protein
MNATHKIIGALEEMGQGATREIAARLGMPHSTATKAISELHVSQVIECIGKQIVPGKGNVSPWIYRLTGRQPRELAYHQPDRYCPPADRTPFETDEQALAFRLALNGTVYGPIHKPLPEPKVGRLNLTRAPVLTQSSAA